jgi:hypothetical protein
VGAIPVSLPAGIVYWNFQKITPPSRNRLLIREKGPLPTNDPDDLPSM